ncbi:hypothetical protein [Anaerorhabdus sp.]|uniref:hypothetical protein n=1 Tax=Anaerorhabdus sp. TaxID=1872524 RepID=UPI002FC8830F
MKKLLMILCSAFLIAGCTTSNPSGSVATPTTSPEVKSEPVVLNVLAPRGATALAMIPVIKNETAKVTFVDGTDVIQAAFVNPNPEYSIIVAPTNLGAKLALGDKTKYKMLGVITWGNLYLVGNDDNALQQEGNLAAFGEGAVPGLVFEATNKDIVPTVTYYNGVADAQAALISENANVALLAEPAATATIGKMKEQGKEVKIIGDLQKEFATISGSEGYPQAAIYVLEDKYNENKEFYDSFITTIADYTANINDSTMDSLKSDIEAITPEELGVPNAEIVAKTWSRMNIRYVPAKDVIDQLNTFLALFDIQSVDSVIIK